MKSYLVAQVSDSHLGPATDEYAANWSVVVDHLEKTKPDLIVHSGDVAFNDANNRDEQDFARQVAGTLSDPWVAIPGNHDVGDGPPDPVFGQLVTAGNCSQFRDRYGADRWRRDVGDWSLIGINSLVFGTGFAEEEAQWSWLAEQIAGTTRPIAIFMHKPPFLHAFEELTESSMTIPAAARGRLRWLVTGSSVSLICCGHAHEYREYKSEGVTVLWAPSTAFILLQKIGEPIAGSLKELGYLEHRFTGEQHSHRLVQPRGLTLYDNAFHRRRVAGA